MTGETSSLQYAGRHEAPAPTIERATTGRTRQEPESARPTALVAIVPVFNERDSVIDVLDSLDRLNVTGLIIVDDGSTDGSGALLDEWALSHRAARLIHLVHNRGKSAALRAACDGLRADLAGGTIADDAIVICVDADGQHDLAYLDALLQPLRLGVADAVIAQRDLSYHGAYKRAGNIAMAALGSVFAGTRLHDIESGYRAFRLGAFLHAHEFYTGHRYSEAVEQAVALSRLGYRVDTSVVVQVPVPRSRTRLRDVFNHVAAMLGAWYRVESWRNVAPERRLRVGLWLSAVMIGAFVGLLAVMLTHRFYLGNDSAQSYAHVWFLQQAVFVAHHIPLHMPNLEAGRALTFPYALVPWLPAALLRPLLGDWVVTATMVAGTVLMMLAIRAWLPRLKSPLLFAMVLVHPELWMGVTQFQLPTVWAFAFACFSAASFDRGHPRRAVALATLALVAHPLSGGAAIGLTLLARCIEDRRVTFARAPYLVVAVLVASPAIWMFLSTPLIGVASFATLWTSVLAILSRLGLLAWPWILHRFSPLAIRLQVPLLAAGVLMLLYNLSILHPKNPWDYSRPRFADFLAAEGVRPDAAYRVLTMTEREDGMVQLMQAGAVLAHEFFDESIDRRSFATTDEYRCFLQRKQATHVLASEEWLRRQYTNEVALLDRLVEAGDAELVYSRPGGTAAYHLVTPPPAECR